MCIYNHTNASDCSHVTDLRLDGVECFLGLFVSAVVKLRGQRGENRMKDKGGGLTTQASKPAQRMQCRLVQASVCRDQIPLIQGF